MSPFSSLLRPVFLVLLVDALATFATAQTEPAATVLDLNDLGPINGGAHMPAAYDGFAWLSSDWYYLTLAAKPDDVFLALSGTATAIVTKGGADFFFDGADYWSRRGADANGRFYFILHHDGTLVYDGREDPDGRNVFTATHQHFAPNYTGPVDVVAVVFDQGGDDWDHLAMDNFAFHGLASALPPTEPTIIQTGESFVIGGKGAPGVPYRIDVRASLDSGAWSQLAVVTADESGATAFTDSIPLVTSRFYRIVAP